MTHRKLSWKIAICLTCAVLFAVAEGSVRADTISFQQGTAGYTGSIDTAIRIDQPMTTAGTATAVTIGTTQTDVELRYLIEWDLSGILVASGGQPVTVNSANLRLTNSTSASGGSPANAGSPTYTLRLYPFDVTNDSTWEDPDGNLNSVTGDPVDGGSLTGAALVSGANLTWSAAMWQHNTLSSAALNSAIEAAANALNPADRVIRFLIYQDNHTSTVREVRNWFSNDWTQAGAGTTTNPSTVNGRPLLTVDYTAVPEPHAVVLAGMAIAGMGLFRFGRRTMK